jgi:hypothetical protein
MAFGLRLVRHFFLSFFLNTILWQGVRGCWPGAHRAEMIVYSSLELADGQCLMKEMAEVIEDDPDDDDAVMPAHLPRTMEELKAQLAATWEGMIDVLGSNSA